MKHTHVASSHQLEFGQLATGPHDLQCSQMVESMNYIASQMQSNSEKEVQMFHIHHP